MQKKVYALLFLLSTLFSGLIAHAQDSTEVKKVEMADQLRSDGKIYVVIGVLVIILLGIVFYVARLDRKISRLEKENK